MALQSKRDELISAWRALGGRQTDEGWHTISVARGGPYSLLAGRHFPGNEEALLVGFSSVGAHAADNLPQGKGFLVSIADIKQSGTHQIWIALRRQHAGSLDLFALMADDIALTLEALSDADDERLFNIFLSRIRAWQDFMKRDGDGVLSPEAEVGLFGELEVLRNLILAGVSVNHAVTAWQGPLSGIHDFTLGTGAIEVKSTLSSTSFPANIGSLDQLDEIQKWPLFIASIRLAMIANGKNLLDQVNELRELVSDDPTAKWLFGSRLLQANFLDTFSDRYTRRFICTESKVLQVTPDIPHLSRSNVPIEIKSAQYEIDLNMLSVSDFGLDQALTLLGVIE